MASTQPPRGGNDDKPLTRDEKHTLVFMVVAVVVVVGGFLAVLVAEGFL